MESELQRWIFFGFMFFITALRSRPTWGERKGREILRYAVFFYCSFFVAIYAVARLLEPQTLVADGAPRDAFLWWTAAAATAGVFGGSAFGRWARRVTAGWNPDSGEVRYRLADRGITKSGSAEQDRDPAD
ncbi:MAG: hypothetical protein PVI87_09475 [Gammaproteobacteria bacterium]|jgi:hypothetical protein